MIDWAEDVAEIYSAENLIVAVSPQAQSEILLAAPISKLNRLVLEKPLAVLPTLADEVLDRAFFLANRVRVGFTLCHTQWSEGFLAALRAGGEFRLCWRFQAHHFRVGLDTWKAQHKSGGGALRFYGIHLLALFESVAPCEVLESTTSNSDVSNWRAVFSIGTRAIVRVEIDSNHESNIFQIVREPGVAIVDLIDPFSTGEKDTIEDVRLQPLMNLLCTFRKPEIWYKDLYRRVIALWASTERSLCIVPFSSSYRS